MKVMFLSNIPSPYRINFFNQLGKKIKLKVVFEAERNYSIDEKWYSKKCENFECVFLKKGEIKEKKINWKILKHIKKKEQDLIVVTNYSYFTELLGLIYIKLRKIPYCLEVDGGIIKKENLILKNFKKYLIKGAIAYISPSKSTDVFLQYYGADKNKIFRYPFTSLDKSDILSEVLDIDKKKEIRKKLEIPYKYIILSVGRFINIKGFDVLIKSCRNLPETVGLYLVGGTAPQEYIELVNKYNKNNIKFIEFMNKNELIEYYQASDIFALATKGDVWGLVINEAMANGLPIITTDKCVAGLELVEDFKNGFIIPVNDVTELTNKINYLLDNPKILNQISKNNITKINDFTIEDMVNKHVEIFKELLGDI